MGWGYFYTFGTSIFQEDVLRQMMKDGFIFREGKCKRLTVNPSKAGKYTQLAGQEGMEKNWIKVKWCHGADQMQKCTYDREQNSRRMFHFQGAKPWTDATSQIPSPLEGSVKYHLRCERGGQLQDMTLNLGPQQLAFKKHRHRRNVTSYHNFSLL